MSNPKLLIIFAGIVCLGFCGLVLAYDIPNPNLNNDNMVDFYDFAILAGNWQQSGAGLAGDFDDSNSVNINDLAVFCWFWLKEYSEYQQCQKADLDKDGIIAFEDLAVFAQNWLLSGSGLTGDFDDSNLVDYADLAVMADCWLAGNRPEGIWEQFKAALRNDNLDMALAFIADSEKEKYTAALTQLRPYFQTMVDGMGNLIFISRDEYTTKYEMLHDEGGGVISSFPVYFSKDEHGEWKISCF